MMMIMTKHEIINEPKKECNDGAENDETAIESELKQSFRLIWRERVKNGVTRACDCEKIQLVRSAKGSRVKWKEEESEDDDDDGGIKDGVGQWIKVQI